MYVRQKTVNGRQYFYLVKSVREGKTVRQKVLKYLGPTRPSKKSMKDIMKKHEGER